MSKLARKVVTRSGRRTRGYYPSLKLRRMVAWESLLERDAILHFEFSPGVKSYREQPELVIYHDGDESRRYFPDFEITGWDDERIHLEVKPQAQLDQPEVAKKLVNVAAHYQRSNRDYRVISEDVIRREPLLTNLTMLSRLRRPDEHSVSVQPDLNEILVHGPACFEELASRFGKSPLLKLIALGRVGCDLAQPLDGHSIIYHPKEIDHGSLYF